MPAIGGGVSPVPPASCSTSTTTPSSPKTIPSSPPRAPATPSAVRGVCDAKGGLVILLYSLLALERSALAQSLQWEILLNPDEEIGSPGSSPLFLEAARRNDLAILFEPALPDGALASSHKGSGTFTIVAHGKTAHSGRDPHLGRNAIHALARLITDLTPLEQEIPGLIVNTGIIHGGTAPNVVPDLAIARINIRVETPDQQQRFETRLAEILLQIKNQNSKIENPPTFDLHGKFSFPPKPLTPPIETLLHHFRDCAALLAMPPLTWRPVGGACDGNRLAAAGLPNVDNLGPIGASMHTDQEFIHLPSLTQRTKLTTLFLLRLANRTLSISGGQSHDPT